MGHPQPGRTSGAVTVKTKNAGVEKKKKSKVLLFLLPNPTARGAEAILTTNGQKP